jgi:hypothetical protein
MVSTAIDAALLSAVEGDQSVAVYLYRTAEAENKQTSQKTIFCNELVSNHFNTK